MRLLIRYIFDDEESRAEGLRGRELGDGECALFVYEDMVYPRFWMRGVGYDLNLAAVSDGAIAWSEFMGADRDDVHACPVPASVMVESVVPLATGSKAVIEGDYLVVNG